MFKKLAVCLCLATLAPLTTQATVPGSVASEDAPFHYNITLKGHIGAIISTPASNWACYVAVNDSNNPVLSMYYHAVAASNSNSYNIAYDAFNSGKPVTMYILKSSGNYIASAIERTDVSSTPKWLNPPDQILPN